MSVRPPTRILVAEDDPDIGSLLEHYLKKAGFLPTIVASGRDVMPQIKRDTPDLVVLDLMLPGLDGLQLCRAIRADADTAAIPIIMLTAKAEESDRIVGLELGADDYITKPFSPNEVVARVRALLRRAHRAAPADNRLSYGTLTVDVDRHVVKVERRGSEADRQGIPAAAIPDAASRPRAVARSAAVGRVELLLHRRHAHRGRARAPAARKSADAGRRDCDRQTIRI